MKRFLAAIDGSDGALRLACGISANPGGRLRIVISGLMRGSVSQKLASVAPRPVIVVI